jgi:LAO/AO transport system kinase
VEDGGPEVSGLLAGIHPHVGRAAVIGFTGPPGAGKSTLIGAYLGLLRRTRRPVAVIAVDPTSPVTGGAILGDRLRMAAQADDDEVFIRSLAARGHLGGLTPAVPFVIDLMDAAGFAYVIIETVGTGQSEVEIAGLASVTILVCAPGQGDEVQAIKAGINEFADILVVNKSDSPLAASTVAQLYAALHLNVGGPRQVPIVSTIASEGKGIAELDAAIATALASRPPRPRDAHERLKRMLAVLAGQALRDMILCNPSPSVDSLCEEVRQGRLSVDSAVRRFCALCG